MVFQSVQQPTDPDSAIARLVLAAKSSIAPEEFLQRLIAEAVEGLSAHFGCLWSFAASEGEFFGHCPNDEHTKSEATILLDSIRTELSSVAWVNSPGVILSREPDSIERESAHFFIQPLKRDQLLLVVCLRGHHSSEALHDRRQFLLTICELRDEFDRNCELRRLRERAELWQQFEEFSLLLQSVSDLETLGTLSVNETRHLCGFDRIHFVNGRAEQCRVEAVTAVDSINQRSESVRTIVDLCRAVMRSNEDLVYNGTQQTLPEEIRSPLEKCLRDSEARLLAVVLLKVTEESITQPATLGALVAEKFDFELSPDGFDRFKALGSHVSAALARVLEWEVLPAKPLLRFWQSLTARGRGGGFPIRRIVIAGVVLAATACLLLIRVEFRVSAMGELQPLERRNIFAQLDGTIVETRSEFETPVKAEERLLKLSRPDLEEEVEQVRGELSKTKARLDAIASLRVNPLNPNVRDERKLAAEENELIVLEQSLNKQLQILLDQQKLLEVKSPLAGTVLTWKAEDLLTSRYVRAGQILMTVAKLDGPWVVDVRIPEKDFQFVNQAFEGSQEKRPVEIMIDARPDQSFAGTLATNQIARTTETDEEKRTFIPARIDVPPSAAVPHRPGTTVRVRIECGRRSLGFVWFHDLREWVYRNLLF